MTLRSSTAGELDEFIVHVGPVFIGEGIPLVAPRHRHIELPPQRAQNARRGPRLKLLSSQSYPDGVVRLHYGVEKKKAARRRRQRGREV